MAVFEHFLFILIGIMLIGAALLGAALYYHFFRFSPDRSVTLTTMGVYSAGLVVIALFAFATMIFS